MKEKVLPIQCSKEQLLAVVEKHRQKGKIFKSGREEVVGQRLLYWPYQLVTMKYLETKGIISKKKVTVDIQTIMEGVSGLYLSRDLTIRKLMPKIDTLILKEIEPTKTIGTYYSGQDVADRFRKLLSDFLTMEKDLSSKAEAVQGEYAARRMEEIEAESEDRMAAVRTDTARAIGDSRWSDKGSALTKGVGVVGHAATGVARMGKVMMEESSRSPRASPQAAALWGKIRDKREKLESWLNLSSKQILENIVDVSSVEVFYRPLYLAKFHSAKGERRYLLLDASDKKVRDVTDILDDMLETEDGTEFLDDILLSK